MALPTAEGGYLVKLVRDKVGEVLGGQGVTRYAPIEDHDEHVRLLRRKLIEEAVEYLDDPSIGELADVLAVVQALAHVDLGVHLDAVSDVAAVKAHHRGGFTSGLGMYAHHSTDAARAVR